MKGWFLTLQLVAVCVSDQPSHNSGGPKINSLLGLFSKSHHGLGSLVFSYKGITFVPNQHKSSCRDCNGHEVTKEIVIKVEIKRKTNLFLVILFLLSVSECQ